MIVSFCKPFIYSIMIFCCRFVLPGMVNFGIFACLFFFIMSQNRKKLFEDKGKIKNMRHKNENAENKKERKTFNAGNVQFMNVKIVFYIKVIECFVDEYLGPCKTLHCLCLVRVRCLLCVFACMSLCLNTNLSIQFDRTLGYHKIKGQVRI